MITMAVIDFIHNFIMGLVFAFSRRPVRIIVFSPAIFSILYFTAAPTFGDMSIYLGIFGVLVYLGLEISALRKIYPLTIGLFLALLFSAIVAGKTFSPTENIPAETQANELITFGSTITEGRWTPVGMVKRTALVGKTESLAQITDTPLVNGTPLYTDPSYSKDVPVIEQLRTINRDDAGMTKAKYGLIFSSAFQLIFNEWMIPFLILLVASIAWVSIAMHKFIRIQIGLHEMRKEERKWAKKKREEQKKAEEEREYQAYLRSQNDPYADFDLSGKTWRIPPQNSDADSNSAAVNPTTPVPNTGSGFETAPKRPEPSHTITVRNDSDDPEEYDPNLDEDLQKEVMEHPERHGYEYARYEKIVERHKAAWEEKQAAKRAKKAEETARKEAGFFDDLNTKDEIENRYHAMAEVLHPGSSSGNADLFQKLQNEYETRLKELGL